MFQVQVVVGGFCWVQLDGRGEVVECSGVHPTREAAERELAACYPQ